MADDALRPVVTQWIEKIRQAWQHKKGQFQDDADECARFMDGPYDWLYKPRGTNSGGFDVEEMDLKAPSVRITINKTAELVQLFGPALYHRNPVRKVTPRRFVQAPSGYYGDLQNDPNAQMMYQQDMMALSQSIEMDAARADLLERYLNYTPTPLDLKTESRWAIVEALVKGMGVLWTQPHRPAGATMTWAGSFYDSVDNLQMDPDAENVRDIKWLSRRRVRPVWEVEREFGLQPDSLRPNPGMESYTAQASVYADPENEYKRRQGRTADLITYHEIYSKMGLGGRLIGIPDNLRATFDGLGDYVYLVVAEGVPYPLNLPPPFGDALIGQGDPALLQSILPEVQQRVSWRTPYWADNAWPCTFFAFHWRPRRLWPMSHLKPGMGELRFLNWAWSFLAQKVRIASRDFLAIAKAAGEEIKERIKHGADYTIIEVESVLGSIDQVVRFLQHPGFNPEIYTVIERITESFERRVGLTELMYGQSSRQYRSAQEAAIKSDAINVRPDDMANSMEDAMTDVARKEAFCARWHLRGQDIQAVLGPIGARLWEQLLVPSDPASILYALEYRIEANSARKPNKGADQEKMQSAVQNLFQPLYSYAQATGDVEPVNALIRDWAKSQDLDPEAYLLKPPPPPPTPAAASPSQPQEQAA